MWRQIIMTHQYVLLFMLLGLNSTAVQNPASDAKAIEAAKHTSVGQIENSLPDKPFEEWLRDLIGPQAHMSWEVNDCGEQTGNPEIDKGRNFPMCVSAVVDLAGKRKLDVQLVVGTFKSGVKTGPASFHHAAILVPNGQTNFVKSLSLLPEAIKAIK
jgi:hypothetical protein